MLALIFNPAKNTRKFIRAAALLDRIGTSYRIYETASRDDIGVQTRRAIGEGAEMVVACGGDGTLLWVINGLNGESLPVAVIPIGCSNDFAKQLGIDSVDDAVRAIAAGECVDVDLGECTFQDSDGVQRLLRFNSTAGLGILANTYTLERFGFVQWSKRVLRDAVWPILCLYALMRTEAVGVRMTIDGQTRGAVMPLVEITKTARNAGFALLGTANPTSGRLHSWWIEGGSKLTLLSILMRGVTGRPLIDSRTVFAGDCLSLEVVPDRPHAVHLNGDFVGHTPAVFRMAEAKTRMIALRS